MRTSVLYNRNRQRGQSLVMAIIVMFVLFFVGAVFVTLVARNLTNSGRATDTQLAYELAQAGVKYADYYLQYSPEGADWRPAPPAGPPPAGSPQNVIDAYYNDPDRQWLDQGYSRVVQGNGRYLVRVTYQPHYSDAVNGVLDPLGKYIRIDAIGRPGFLDPSDPTSYLNTPTPRLRRELLAYKSIGLTDYVRWVTNISNDSKFEAVFGVELNNVPLAQQYGKLPQRLLGAATNPNIANPGAPIWVNGDLRVYTNPLYYPTSGSGYNPAQNASVIFSVDPRNGEQIDVTGSIRFEDGIRPAAFKDPVSGNVFEMRPSEASNFSTFGGLLRDGMGVPDLNGYARNISRKEPPRLDLADPATSISRYRMNTRNAGLFIGPVGNQFNTGRFGLGQGVYIDNFNSIQRQTTNQPGGYTLRNDWMSPGISTNWNGPFYLPPGANIEFGYPIVQDRDASGTLVANSYSPHPGFTITRDDRAFRDPNGNIAPKQMAWTYFIYKAAGQAPVIKLDNEFFRTYLKGQGMSEAQIDAFLPAFNGVIYAEGNARVRGLLASKTNMQIRRASNSADVILGGGNVTLTDQQVRDYCNPPALTVVSGATIYIDGSIVREPYTELLNPKRTFPGSMISLLATDYVTVNSTLFVSPNGRLQFEPTNDDSNPPFSGRITLNEAGNTPPFAMDFIFGDTPNGYTYNLIAHGAPDPADPYLKSKDSINLLVRHATPAPSSFLNLRINEAYGNLPAADPAYYFNGNVAPYNAFNPPPNVYPLSDSTLQQAPVFEQRPLALWNNGSRPYGATYPFFTNVGSRNQIRPLVDPNFTAQSGTQDYLFSRAAVVPMDVRIEAIMYAQNGSFFIIPGYPLNPNPRDTRDAAMRNAYVMNPGWPSGSMIRPAGTSDFYPFYGEPYDCRLTIVGAISENRTASAADQAAWQALWGYIPQFQGSTGHNPQLTTPKQPIPDQHLYMTDVGLAVPANDPRQPLETSGLITRGLRILYDPFLHAPYPSYDPSSVGITRSFVGWAHTEGGIARQDSYGRGLAPVPRLPVCPDFAFYGEVP